MNIYAIGYDESNLVTVCRELVFCKTEYKDIITSVVFNTDLDLVDKNMFTIYSDADIAQKDIDEMIQRRDEICFDNRDMIEDLLGKSSDDYNPNNLKIFEFCLLN